MIIGIDEAGKGPIIGSMFVAGIYAKFDDILYLKKLNIKDSKKLSNKKRKEIYNKIISKIKDYYILEIKACVIDELRKIMTMNQIMNICYFKVIKNLYHLESNVIIVDACDVYENRFKENILNYLKRENMNPFILSKHKADEKYLIVSAASILAKVCRDNMIEKLKIENNFDFGSGYPSDKKTINFLKKYNFSNLNFNRNIRFSWKTIDNLRKC